MKALTTEVCIIGLGPAGLGAALRLARNSSVPKTICLEAGVAVEQKLCTILQGKGCRYAKPCQIVSGVGGSSVLSGGKISAFPAGRALTRMIGDDNETRSRLQESLEIFQEFVPLISPSIADNLKQDASIQFLQQGFNFRYYDAYRYHPTDMVSGYGRMVEEIHSAGISTELGMRVTQVTCDQGGFYVYASRDEDEIQIFAEKLIVAVGRSGTELLKNLNAPLDLEGTGNHCDVGVRLEFPTAYWRDIDYCHHDLKLHFGRARTFCVCKDGFIAPYRHDDIFLLEGSDAPNIFTGFTNLAITIRIPSNYNLDGQILLAEVRERLLRQSGGKPVRQKLQDFLGESSLSLKKKQKQGDPASITYWRWGNVAECFPENIATDIRNAVEYFVTRLLPKDAYSVASVFAPELDYYWLKFPLQTGFHSTRPGLYIIGDCTGHFRGILQAFCSGLTCADYVLGVGNVS